MKTQDTEQEATRIADEGTDVRRRTRELIVDAIKSGKESGGRFTDAAGKVIDGAWRGVEDVADEKQADVFRDVFDGLADGLSQGAHAVKLTIEEAKSRGESYARDEIVGTAEDLRALESMFVERIEKLAKASKKTTTGQAGDLFRHARRATSAMLPEITTAIKAAETHPIGLAKETASVAAGASRRAAGSLIRGIGGVLDGLGDAVGGVGSKDKDEDEDKPS